jgi:hypothetical protein
MPDDAFYNAGVAELKGWRRGIVPLRRLLRRCLRPIFYRQAELFAQLGSEIEKLRVDNRKLTTEAADLRCRLDQVEASLKAILGLSCDVLAIRRRLAAMEDRQIADGPSEPNANRVPAPHLAGKHALQTR